MTLIPVSNISSFVFCSMNAGASLWMGSRRLASIGPILIHGLADDIHHAAERSCSDRNR